MTEMISGSSRRKALRIITFMAAEIFRDYVCQLIRRSKSADLLLVSRRPVKTDSGG
jgi:hypothetical protein